MKNILAWGTLFCILSLFIGCEREVSFTENEEETNSYFQLELNSNPQGAKVYFGDKATGYATPCTMKYVNSGYHSIKLKLDLFADGNFGVSGNQRQRVQRFYDFYSDTRNYGQIYCNSTPYGAAIYLDGNKTGLNTPAPLVKLWPGKYRVKYELKNYRADSLEAVVSANGTFQANIAMIDTTVYVDYTRETDSFYGSCVYADRKGRIWYGTAYNGAFVYENRRFTNFNHHNSSLPTNTINLFFEDSGGNIWIGTTGGLVKYSAFNEWAIYTNSNTPLPISQISGICEDQNRNIWISCGKAVLKFDGINWTIYSYGNSNLPNNDMTSITCSTDNSIWVSANNFGAYKYDGNTWTAYNSTNSAITTRYLSHIAAAPGNVVYAVAIDGIFKFSGGVWSKVNISLGGAINGVFVDNTGTLWVGLSVSTLVLKPDGTSTSFIINSVPNVSSVSTRGFAKDSEKNIWISTYKLGLVKYKYGK